MSYIDYVTTKLQKGPFITVDAIIEIGSEIVLIQRSNPPFGLALPGGFVDYGESLEEAVIREAKEETNLDLEDLRQFHTYSEPGRDPRFHTIATVFIAKAKGKPKAGDDAADLKVVKLTDIPKLKFAFDHKKILTDYTFALHHTVQG
ncbi:MAG: NUDIX hydrolase [Candidatus Omnitrophota bacterium]|nr:NUDIX hydrolase [Candidatus Omnitrophota bacterium]